MLIRKLLAMVITCCAIGQATAIGDLEFVGGYPLDGIDNLNASGLAYCDGKLLMVSDNHDNEIFQVTIKDKIAAVEPYLDLAGIPSPQWPERPLMSRIKRWLSSVLMSKTYDWEGISCDQNGNIYLISESAADIFILANGNENDSQWMNSRIFSAGRESGLFNIDNAFTEGVAVSGDAMSLFVAAERQPRGLLKLGFTNGGWAIDMIELEDDSVLATPAPGRLPDYAGLALHNGHLFTLERNASAVCQRNVNTLGAIQCWSYRFVEESDDFGYTNAKYGLGEGLAITEDKLYIVFDHNGDARRAAQDDHRGLLLVFKAPQTGGVAH